MKIYWIAFMVFFLSCPCSLALSFFCASQMKECLTYLESFEVEYIIAVFLFFGELFLKYSLSKSAHMFQYVELTWMKMSQTHVLFLVIENLQNLIHSVDNFK